MNLSTLGNLVRRIRLLLRQHEQEKQGSDLAQDFGIVCQATAQRLAQCEAMLACGNESQALQLAETAPPIMEVLARIGFRELAQWRAYCLAQNYPVPPALDAGIIHRLNEVYSSRIGLDHPLYKEYRGATMRRDDDQALVTLRLIAQLNPSDGKMQEELQRVEARILRHRLEELATLLESAPPPEVVRRIEEIEGLALRKGPTGSAWQRAQHIRVRVMLEVLPAARQAEDWGKTLAVVEDIKALCAEHRLDLSAEEAATLQGAADWATHESAEFEEATLYENTLAELNHLIEQCQLQRMSLKGSTVRMLRVRHEGLLRKWGEVERFGRALPKGLEEELAQAVSLLEIETDVKLRQRRNLIMVVSGVVVVLAIAVGFWLARQRKIADTAWLIGHAVTNREVMVTSNLLVRAQRELASAAASPALQGAIQTARAWLGHETEQLAGVRRSLTELSSEAGRLTNGAAATDALSPAQWQSMQGRMEQVEQQITALAPESQKAVESLSRQVLRWWKDCLSEGRQKINQAFQEGLGEARSLKAAMKHENGPDRVADALKRLEECCRRLETRTNAPVPGLAIDPTSIGELADLRGACDKYRGDLAQYTQATNTLTTATTLEAYLKALRDFKNNDFSRPEQRSMAEAVLTAHLSTNQVCEALLPILSVAGTAGWSNLLAGSSLRLSPDTATATEKERLSRLITNYYCTAVFLLKEKSTLVSRTNYGLNSVEQNAFSLDNTGTSYITDIYRPEKSPGSVAFVHELIRTQDFHKRYEINPVRLPERDVHASTKLSDLLSDTGKYAEGLLEVADRIRSPSNCVVLRAYLLLRLGEVMDERPADWGLPWAPAFNEHRNALQRITSDAGADLKSGDWLAPARREGLTPGLVSFFRERQPVSYVRQARFFHRLARELVRVGLAHAGHVSADSSQPVLSQDPKRQPLWGLSAQGKKLTPLFRWVEGRGYEPIGAAVPFTPLLTIGEDPQLLVEAADRESRVPPDDPSVKPWLPDAFAKPKP